MLTPPCPANWVTGNQFTANDEDNVEVAVNALYAGAIKTSSYTLTDNDHFIAADATTAAMTLTLPTAVGRNGTRYDFVKVDASNNVVTIATTSSQTINGVTTQLLIFQYHRVSVISNGTNWLIVQHNYHGTELGYAESYALDTTTNTSATDASLTANKISGLSITTIGTGRAVSVEFLGSAWNSTANNPTAASLLINNSAANGTLAIASSPQTNTARVLFFRRRLVLTTGVSYTFEVGKSVFLGGTGTYFASTSAPVTPMYLSVVGQ